MASSLYEQMTGNAARQNVTSGPAINLKDVLAFSNSLRGQNPQAIVQNLLQNGSMTKEQFETYGQAATRFLGG